MKDKKENKLVELISVQGEIEENMVVSLLESEGIDTLVKSGRAGGALPISVDGMGRVRIYVREGEAERARKVLEEHHDDGQ
ncbi:MAG: hypothetical protein GF417_01270 [Candidatus Latescibacteria bacterium]|nr:hypothetical protein [bacterium]MBD3423057.1 hypothetical protein [Candidatus Latescibacterota bacterium]